MISSRILHVFKTNRPQCMKLLTNSMPLFIRMLIFGPPRDRDDQKLDLAMVNKWLAKRHMNIEEDNG
jgi:hypothetical protein